MRPVDSLPASPERLRRSPTSDHACCPASLPPSHHSQVAGDYDALGARSLDAARRGARREAEARHPELPVLLDDELVGSGAEPVGLLLLKQLGWYLGKRLGEFVSEKGRKSRLLAEASSGRVAAVRGRHGVGYDGGAVAGLLRRGAVAGPLATVGTDDRRLAFGLGSAHGVEDGGIGGDLVQDDGFFLRGRGIGLDGRPADQRGSLRRAALGDRLLEAGYSFEIADGSDDEAVLGTTAGPGAAAPLLESREAVQRKRDLVPSGFAPEIDLFEFTSPPPIAVPGGWLPRFEDSKRSAARPRSPRWAPPPEDAELRARIDAAALQVARGGEAVERVLRARRGADPGWEFLSADGVGWSYFQSKVRGEGEGGGEGHVAPNGGQDCAGGRRHACVGRESWVACDAPCGDAEIRVVRNHPNGGRDLGDCGRAIRRELSSAGTRAWSTLEARVTPPGCAVAPSSHTPLDSSRPLWHALRRCAICARSSWSVRPKLPEAPRRSRRLLGSVRRIFPCCRSPPKPSLRARRWMRLRETRCSPSRFAESSPAIERPCAPP